MAATKQALGEAAASIDPTSIMTPGIKAANISKGVEAAKKRLTEIRSERGLVSAQILLGLVNQDSDHAQIEEQILLEHHLERVELGTPHIQNQLSPLYAEIKILADRINCAEEEADQLRAIECHRLAVLAANE